MLWRSLASTKSISPSWKSSPLFAPNLTTSQPCIKFWSKGAPSVLLPSKSINPRLWKQSKTTKFQSMMIRGRIRIGKNLRKMSEERKDRQWLWVPTKKQICCQVIRIREKSKMILGILASKLRVPSLGLSKMHSWKWISWEYTRNILVIRWKVCY